MIYRRLSRNALVVLLCLGCFGVFATAHPRVAAACSCASFPAVQTFKSSDAVFTGKLVDTIGSDRVRSSNAQVVYVFAVDKVYKGEVHAKQAVLSNAGGASCGLELRSSGPQLVFARRVSDDATGAFHSGLCSGTRPLAEGGPLPAGLATPSDPLPGSSAIPDIIDERVPTWVWGAGGVVVASLVGVVTVMFLRRRSSTGNADSSS